MPISAAGSSLPPLRGFTLLELLLVLAIVALASLGVTLSLPDAQQSRLEREGLRLAALLDAARARARAAATPVLWVSDASGFHFESRAPILKDLPQGWLDSDTVADPSTLLLSPQPVSEPQTVTLRAPSGSARHVRIGSDGVRPFVLAAASSPTQ